MRKELYKALCERLKTVGEGKIKHIDLWNRNVEYIEQEDNWPRPAVFVEFGPIEWQPFTGRAALRGTCRLKLHIVTDWSGSAADGSPHQDELLEVFDYSADIQRALEGMQGQTYSALTLKETHTNHDHDEIVESIEVYELRCTRQN